MLTPESKIRVLENFHSIDYVIFGKPVNKFKKNHSDLVNEFTNTKGALLSIVIEMYKLIDHAPKVINEKINTSSLISRAKKSAVIAREHCQQLVSTDKSRNEIKNELRESLINDPDSDITELVSEQIRKKSFSLAVDNLLVARTLNESLDFKKLVTWEGKIIEDAYKILRNSLIENALDIINAESIVS